MSAAFEYFKRSHNGQQGEPGIATDNRPVFSKYAYATKNNHWNKKPVVYSLYITQILQAAPGQRDDNKAAYP